MQLEVSKSFFAVLLAVGLLLSRPGHAQFFWNQELKSGLKLLDKQEFDKLHKKLEKDLEKDPRAVIPHYLYSRFYADTLNPLFEMDSSYQAILNAIKYHVQLSEEEVTKLQEKEGLSGEMLTYQKQKIENWAYSKALAAPTEKGFQEFIHRFGSAMQVTEAQLKRDSIAFEQAQRENTYQSYEQFARKYPNARQAEVALERYHRLVFLQKTKYQTADAFEAFIREHPESPYRADAEKQLFYTYAYDNHLKTYETFVKKFPKSPFADLAWEWIWAFNDNKESFLQKYPEYPKPAGVKERAERERETYYPFMEEKKIGFINASGEIRIASNFVSVPETYLCDGLSTDFIIVQKGEKLGAIDKLGNKVLPYEFDKIDDFSTGTLLVTKGGKHGLYQKGGFSLIYPKYEELAPIDNSLIKARIGDKWGIITYYDSLVYPFKLDGVSVSKGGLIILEKFNRYAFIHAEELLEASQRNLHPEYSSLINFQVETYEIAHDNYLKYFKKGKWGVMTLYGREIIPPQQDYIEDSRHGWIVSANGRHYLYSTSGDPVSQLGFSEVLVGKKAYGVKRDSLWGVLNLEGSYFIQPLYDTLFFIDEKGILLERDNKKFGYFYSEDLTDFSSYKKLNVQSTLLNPADTSLQTSAQTFIITEDQRGRKGMLSDQGRVKVKNRYDHLSLTDEGVVVVGLKELRGIIDLQGSLLLPVIYNGIAKYDRGFFSVLGNNKKFGVFHPSKNVLLKPNYDALLKLYGSSDSLFIAKKGKFGLINSKEEVIADFRFDELRHWNDSVALTRTEEKWRLYNFRQGYYLPESFDTFEYLQNSEAEKVIITFRSSGHGLLSSTKGRIMPEEYTDIRNIGSAAEPLYLAEKHLAQASLFILLYIDSYGQVLKQQIVQEEDYPRISCQD